MSEAAHTSGQTAGTWRWLLMVALWLGAVGNVWALRCGNLLVSEHDSTVTLVQRCGEPVEIETHHELRAVRVYDQRLDDYVTDYQRIPYEIWFYNFGPNRFMMRITVRDGVITRMESAGYGY